MDEAEAGVPACMEFPARHRAKLHNTNLPERPSGEIKHRSDAIGIFPNEDALVRLIGTLLLEQNDEWPAERTRAMTLGSIALLGDNPLVSLPPLATRHLGPTRPGASLLHHAVGHDLTARQATALNRCNNTVAQIVRIGLRHPCRPPLRPAR